MKKLLFTLMLFTLLFSCSNDDKFEHIVEGKWKFTNVLHEVSTNDTNLTSMLYYWLDLRYKDKNPAQYFILEFKGNKKMKLTSYYTEDIDNIPYTINGNKITIRIPQQEPMVVEFQITGHTLFFINDMTQEGINIYSPAFPNATITYAKTTVVMSRM